MINFLQFRQILCEKYASGILKTRKRRKRASLFFFAKMKKGQGET